MLQLINLQRKWLVLGAILIAMIGLMIVSFWQQEQRAEEKYKKAVVLQQEQMEQTVALRETLHISQMNSKELQAAYGEVEHELPSFMVQAPTLQVAAEQVADRINAGDKSLPAETIAKTDRTAVVKNDQVQKVEVLKINLDKAWEISIGVGDHRGDFYVPIGVQRNYAANKAVAVEAHMVAEELARGKTKTSGWEVRHVWRY